MCRIDTDENGMKMKIPNAGSGNGYYGQELPTVSYFENPVNEADTQGGGDVDFSEYMWMEHEEEFDKQVLQQLEEEELMEECIEAMLEDERQHDQNRTSTNRFTSANNTENSSSELNQQMSNLQVGDELAQRSTLNPYAEEFIPDSSLKAPNEIRRSS